MLIISWYWQLLFRHVKKQVSSFYHCFFGESLLFNVRLDTIFFTQTKFLKQIWQLLKLLPFVQRVTLYQCWHSFDYRNSSTAYGMNANCKEKNQFTLVNQQNTVTLWQFTRSTGKSRFCCGEKLLCPNRQHYALVM